MVRKSESFNINDHADRRILPDDKGTEFQFSVMLNRDSGVLIRRPDPDINDAGPVGDLPGEKGKQQRTAAAQ